MLDKANPSWHVSRKEALSSFTKKYFRLLIEKDFNRFSL